jgi:predicted site-specific integrase-resolvase
VEPSEKLLSRVEAADLIGVSPWTIKRWEKLGRLHPVRLSALTVRIRESEILALIAAGSSK